MPTPYPDCGLDHGPEAFAGDNPTAYRSTSALPPIRYDQVIPRSIPPHLLPSYPSV
ncbi:hypothetical protein THIOKS13320025 [Thiocapsa sp. KS1]|nr:hypothetical protein THIOKS13320025 [Thiocapsa sp. KS1]